ncbi:MAG: hypothetical protein K1000chlam4_00679, partial [Chlamydiae bacterium]|nr:hypothetical protein [Chlamydiota bacterium]
MQPPRIVSIPGYKPSNIYAKPAVYSTATTVALVGIAAVTAGLLSQFGVVPFSGLSALAQWSFIGGGGAALVFGATGGVIYYLRARDMRDSGYESEWRFSGETTYKVCTWNIGTNSDYRIARLKENRDTPEEETKTDDKVKEERTGLLKDSFGAIGQQDIVCLQERFDFTTSKIKEFLGDGYEVQSEIDGEEARPGDTLVAWNTQKFKFLGSSITSLNYGAAFSAGVLLQDKHSGAIVRVASAHITGFDLATDIDRIQDAASSGDQELTELAVDCLGSDAHLAIIGMDANASRG